MEKNNTMKKDEQKQQEHKISQETIEGIANRYINKDVTNSDIFEMVRGFQQSSLDRNNTKLTNIGELYWFLIRIRDERIAA